MLRPSPTLSCDPRAGAVMVKQSVEARYWTPAAPLWDAEKHGIPDIFSVNESFSKRFEFAENPAFIRFECAQKREQPFNPSVSVCHAAP